MHVLQDRFAKEDAQLARDKAHWFAVEYPRIHAHMTARFPKGGQMANAGEIVRVEDSIKRRKAAEREKQLSWEIDQGIRPDPEHSPERQAFVDYCRRSDEWGDKAMAWINQAWDFFMNSAEDETGLVIPEDSFLRMEKQNESDLRTGNQIALKMDDAGLGGFSNSRSVVEKIGLFTLSRQVEPDFRRCNFNNYHAKKKRAKMLVATEYLLANLAKYGGGRARFWTVTGGGRVLDWEIGERFSEIFRRISLLNSRDWFREYFEIIFRGSELGSLHNTRSKSIENSHGIYAPGAPFKDAQGRWLFHPHCHLIVIQKRYMPPTLWEEYKARIREALGGFTFDEGGQIRNVREVIKYFVKSQDLIALDLETFKTVYYQLFKRRLCTPMGRLRDFIWEINDKCRKVERPKKTNGFRYRLVPNVNAHLKPLDPDEDEFEVELDKVRVTDKDSVAEDWCVFSWVESGPHGSPIKEPGVYIRRSASRPVTDAELMQHPRIRQLADRCRPAYLAGLELASISGVMVRRRISLDTTPVTAQAAGPFSGAPPGPNPTYALESLPDRPPSVGNEALALAL